MLDDVHWAEPALVDLIDYLADRADAPLLVICLARPELDRPLGEPIALGPLGEEEARAIVAGTAVVDEETRERIVELAEGNALYAEQLASFAAEGGEGLPPTLEAVLAGRLGRLDRRGAVGPAARGRRRPGVLTRRGRRARRRRGRAASCSRSHAPASSTPPRPPTRATTATPSTTSSSATPLTRRLTKADRADLHERAAAWIDRDGTGDDAIAGYHLEQAVRYRRELGEDADELAAAAGERLGEAGMRVWRTNDVAAAVGLLGRAVRCLPAGSAAPSCSWSASLALRLQDRP